ncbi:MULTISPECIES: hypothetical protein [Thalassotalea]|uniref:hypothetical protein n=1 Tax=Thalassotalea TaxID=1518149 RepID=UPI0015881A2B|nr:MULTISPECIES: hypothetical protein [Thalassotalea]
MDFLLNILMALGLVPAKGLTDSMQKSKALTVMVIIGLILLGAFVLFLFYMAAKQ